MDAQPILIGAQDALTVRRVFGEPLQADGATIVPAAVVSGGGGGGGSRAETSGVGFGLAARPAGVFVIKNGEARWRPAVDVNRVILGGQLVAAAGCFALGTLLFQWIGHRQSAAR